MKTRTYLCPDCDGYGATAPGCHHFHNDPACDCEVMCDRCDESGVIEASYEEGEEGGYQPWTGDVGRGAARVRIRRLEWLDEMARCRRINPRSVAYDQARRRALPMAPGFAKHLSAEAAICFARTAWRNAA